MSLAIAARIARRELRGGLAVALSEDKYCTVGGSLRDPVAMSHKITLVED